MKWSKLHALGTSKIVNSSVVWLALIPFLSRVLESVQSHGAHVTLPFNFVAFYYAALAFAFAAVVFQFWCPDLIKHAPDFGAFKAKGYSDNELKNWYNEIASHGRDSADQHMIEVFMDRTGVRRSPGMQLDQLMLLFWNGSISTHLGEGYDEAKNRCDTRSAFARGVATFFYGLGFLAFAIVAIGNLIVVWDQTKLWWNALSWACCRCCDC